MQPALEPVMLLHAYYLGATSSSVTVSRIDTEFNVIGSTLHLRNVVAAGPAPVAAAGNALWVAPSSGLLTRVDQTTGRIVQQLDPNANPSAIAVGEGGVWVADSQANNVTRVAPNGRLTPIPVGNGPAGIAVGGGAVWVADSLDDTLVRIDPGTRSVTAKIPVGRFPAGVAVGARSVWVANSGDGTVSRIDPRTDKVIATISVGGSPQALAVADGRVWVTVDARTLASGAATRGGGTLRIDSPFDVGPMDPAVSMALGVQLLQATCAKLMNFPDKPGPAGSVPTPEVARSLPVVSDGGKTYTFTIRPGFRFSPPSDQPVTAQTFKYTLERTLHPRIKSGFTLDFTDIVGAGAYVAGRRTTSRGSWRAATP